MEFDHSDPSLDGALDVLADARRRTVLRYLCRNPDNVATVEEVIRFLHAEERTTGGEPMFARERLETELHHRHLPKLEEHGLVEYDLRSGQIRYEPDETIEELLAFVENL